MDIPQKIKSQFFKNPSIHLCQSDSGMTGKSKQDQNSRFPPENTVIHG